MGAVNDAATEGNSTPSQRKILVGIHFSLFFLQNFRAKGMVRCRLWDLNYFGDTNFWGFKYQGWRTHVQRDTQVGMY